MNDILVIIPLHEFNDDVKPLLTDAVKSVPTNVKITISTTKNLSDSVSDFSKDYKNVSVKTSDGDASDFPSLVNQAVDSNYKWFTVLEFDDEFTPIWFDEVKKYIEFKPNNSIFIPFEDLVDFNTKEYAGIANAAPWASSFSNEIGEIDLDCLQNFFDFYMTGSVFNTSDWNEMGGLKPNIKVYFWYELLLRFANKGKKISVVPKIGYNHYLGRKGSLLEEYKESISKEEAKYWFGVAKKEYFFSGKDNREIKPYSKKEAE